MWKAVTLPSAFLQPSLESSYASGQAKLPCSFSLLITQSLAWPLQTLVSKSSVKSTFQSTVTVRNRFSCSSRWLPAPCQDSWLFPGLCPHHCSARTSPNQHFRLRFVPPLLLLRSNVKENIKEKKHLPQKFSSKVYWSEPRLCLKTLLLFFLCVSFFHCSLQ